MGEMDRRTFLLATGRWLAVAALAPTVSGCARLLRWSDSQGGLNDSDTVSVGGLETSTTELGAPATTTTSLAVPDLAVITGESPDLNVRARRSSIGRHGTLRQTERQGRGQAERPHG